MRDAARTPFGRVLCGLFWLAGIWATCGCERAGPAIGGASCQGATVQVVNLCDYTWTITLSRVGGGQSKSATLAPRAAQVVVVPAGEYRIEQSASGGSAGAIAPRVLTASLVAGVSYRWPMTTLLSDFEPPGSPGAGR